VEGHATGVIGDQGTLLVSIASNTSPPQLLSQMKFLSFLFITLLAVVSGAKEKKGGSKSTGPAKKKGPGQCALPDEDVLKGFLLGLFAALDGGLDETAEALCEKIAGALDRCDEGEESCVCELQPSDFDEEQCAADLITISSDRRKLSDDPTFAEVAFWMVQHPQIVLANSELCTEQIAAAKREPFICIVVIAWLLSGGEEE